MPDFKDLKSLYKYVEKDISYSLGIIAEKVRQLLREYIEKELYQSYTPTDYQRTRDFINSLDIKEVKKVGDFYSVEIFFNTGLIHSNEVENSGWNQHMDVYGNSNWYGASIPEWMPYFIEWGTHNSLWDRDGLHSMDAINKYVKQTDFHLKEIEKILKSKGYNVKIV